MRPGRKYRLHRYADEIEIVQLHRETDKMYLFIEEPSHRVTTMRKSNSPLLYETWDEAHAALVVKVATHIEACKHEIVVLKQVARRVAKMKEPK